MSPGKGFLQTLPVIVLLATQVVLAPAASAAPGDLDPSFGTGGKVTTDFSGFGGRAAAVALQPDGKIIAGGRSGGASFFGTGFAVARYNADGSLDSSFGVGGTVTIDFGFGDDEVHSVLAQPDGKIVAAGSKIFLFPGDFELVRYNADGSLDASFGVGGKVTTDISFIDGLNAAALQPDGKIVVAGGAGSLATGNLALARYNPDGTLDTTFGTGGIVVSGLPVIALSLALQADGRLVIAGASGVGFGLARFNADGSLDTSFGTGGLVTTNFPDGFASANAVALQPDGKIVAVGGGSVPFVLARYNADGSLDTSFGVGGKVTGTFADFAIVNGVVVRPDGKIVVVGAVGAFPTTDFALARYNTDGSLDPTFGTGGKVTTDFADGFDFAQAVALQPDGKIVAAGVATIGSTQDFALARYEGGAVITVPIDIKPGSITNPIKLSSTGRMPVAILSTSPFDATTTDPTSVCFGDAEAPAQRDCTAAHSSLEDVNGDGRLDLLLLFETTQTGIDLGDTQACLTGRTLSDLGVEGCDSIKTL
jgi:uncharacterized delta-60 repeat protein